MDIPSKRGGSLWVPTLFALLAVSLLSAVTVIWKRDAIEVDLLQRVRTVIYGILPGSILGVSIDGRDVTIRVAEGDLAAWQEQKPVLEAIDGLNTVNLQAYQKTILPIQYQHDNSQVTFANGLYIPQRKHPLEKIDLKDVVFKYAQAELNESSFDALNQLVKQLEKYPDVEIEISAHTDNAGTVLGSMAMSYARAFEVAKYLVDHGLENERIKAVGYGASRPITSNATEAGRRKNQRVELIVLRE